jgi:hypothetical protein
MAQFQPTELLMGKAYRGRPKILTTRTIAAVG